MNHYEVKQHLMALLSGEKSIDDLKAIGTPEAEEAVTISARNFNDITMASRDILSAMTSKFVTKVKAGKRAYAQLIAAGMKPADAVFFLGKKLEFQIAWDWIHTSEPYLKPVTPLPGYRNGNRIPICAVLQDFDAAQCRRLYKWVTERAKVS
ncbi:hypothetical protein [Pseudomonas phage Alpheus]|uniref:Uncharacterized protein n=1 Tax=Pseudomonas phage Alpheus TaxID=2163983 RepID=A0A2S1GMY3_9CAUD|nr:hypothetical protein HOT11_gp10 [Pseudomonas phage Alpheus]AWD90734.1 hypothetical protein [Pseudomonas phage Alpheus]